MVVNYRKIDAPVFCLLTVASSDPEIGSAEGGGVYKEGQFVTVTAQAAEGKAVFSGWRDASGQIVSSEAAYTFQINADTSLTAVFAKLCSVTCVVMPSGTGSFTGAGIYQSGASVTVTAVPDEGYMFSGWLDAAGNLLSSGPAYTFTVTQDVALTAKFAVKCLVTILLGLEGAGSPTGAGVYPQGAAVTVNAGTNEGYRFTGWKDSSGAIVSTAESYSFTVTGNTALTAEYVQVFSVVIAVNIAGAGVPSGMGEYEAGSTVTVSANAADGYTFTGWQAPDGSTLSASEEYTFTINSDVTLLAVYEEAASRLPAGYTELEYIQGGGPTYINTGLPLSAMLRLVMDFSISAFTSSTRNFFGGYYTSGSKIRQFRAFETNSTTLRIAYGGNASSNPIYTDFTLTLGRHTVELNAPDKYCVLDAIRKDINMSYVPDFPSSTTPVALCAARNGSQIMGVGGVTLYSCQIWDNGILIRDYIPCKDPSGKVGLYDAVEQAFNAGVGTFTAGPAI